ncbi:hypothetical protein BIU87_20710 [Streptomyces sp. ZS0098]|uniref:hypothetical protein n=1 Tax=Streptomyces sp. ZS0098 TaxID=1904044 RepID=UPI000EFCD798|nr:hypothetical protein [Streptomyces sp. ZS0098]RMI92028.1 hypothetical protein BIU87_20710 [Streptomyces sp. ZS0098]
MSKRPPLGAAAVWEAVTTAADDRCQCSGGLCGSQHAKTDQRCIETTARGRLIVAPLDLTLSDVAAAAVPAEDLRAWCLGCHAKAHRRQLAAQRELERQAADEPLALF